MVACQKKTWAYETSFFSLHPVALLAIDTICDFLHSSLFAHKVDITFMAFKCFFGLYESIVLKTNAVSATTTPSSRTKEFIFKICHGHSTFESWIRLEIIKIYFCQVVKTGNKSWDPLLLNETQ